MAGSLVDAHVHVWDWQLDHYGWMTDDMAAIRRPFTTDDLRSELDRHQVSGAVLVQTLSSEAETRRYLELAAADPHLLGVVGWVDLTSPMADELIAAHCEGRGGAALVGVRHQVHDETDPNWLDRADVRRGIAKVGRHGLVYELLVRPRELPAAIRLVEDHGDQDFVLDHIAKPPIASGRIEPWKSQMRRFAAQPHVACKLSGLVTEADRRRWTVNDLRPYADVVLESFGPERVLFGSDWPVCTLAATYTQVIDAARALVAGLPEAERVQIFGGNAAAVYGLASSL